MNISAQVSLTAEDPLVDPSKFAEDILTAAGGDPEKDTVTVNVNVSGVGYAGVIPAYAIPPTEAK